MSSKVKSKGYTININEIQRFNSAWLVSYGKSSELYLENVLKEQFFNNLLLLFDKMLIHAKYEDFEQSGLVIINTQLFAAVFLSIRSPLL